MFQSGKTLEGLDSLFPSASPSSLEEAVPGLARDAVGRCVHGIPAMAA